MISLFEGAETVRLSGLGNKAIVAAVNDFFYFAPSMGLGYWDVCAAHAITRELKGGCFYVDGEEIMYPHSEKETILPKCFCMSSSKDKIDLFIKVLNENKIVI